MFKFSFLASLVGLFFLFQNPVFGQKKGWLNHNSRTTADTTIALCPGDAFLLNNVAYTAPNLLQTLLPNGTPLTINLIEKKQPRDTAHFHLCPGELLLVNGLYYNEEGAFFDTFPAKKAGACDSIATYIFTFKFQPTIDRVVKFCPGTSVVLAGKTYDFPGIIKVEIPAVVGCDTAATFHLEYLPEPTKTGTFTICPGESVKLGGQEIFLPGIYDVTLPASVGCDTLAKFTVKIQPNPKKTINLKFCGNETVTLGGQNYSQSGTVKIYIPSTTGGCDTLATYVLEKIPNPTRSQTISFCPGETVTLGGQNYSQPGAVKIYSPSTTGGCDTLVTYFLVKKTDGQTSSVSMNCPPSITQIVAAGATSAVVDYDLPTAVSDCICDGLVLEKTSGGASGTAFPVGKNSVCWRAEDFCGTVRTCCFSINIEEESTCDEHQMSCLKWELLTVQRTASKDLAYRIRVTNRCVSSLTHTFFGIPQGISAAVEPSNGSIFEAASGREYEVRNPNFSPVRSIRFKGLLPDLLDVGESDVFRVVLPSAVLPTSIYVAGRLKNGLFEEWYLNTSDCPIGIETSSNRSTWQAGSRSVFSNFENEFATENLQVVPNPAASGESLRILGGSVAAAEFLLFDVAGGLVFQGRVIENFVNLEGLSLPTGLFFYRVFENGRAVGGGKLVVAD